MAGTVALHPAGVGAKGKNDDPDATGPDATRPDAMALLEMKKCAHCGHNTWQEFVPLSPPAPSYWRCRECGERREAARVCLCEHDLLHQGRIQTETACLNVCIVNISQNGACLRLDDDAQLPARTGDQLLFNAQLQPFGELSQYQRATVRWLRGQDFGLHFDRPLSLTSTDLRRIIKN